MIVSLTGTLGGLPSTAGEYSFTVRVTDADNKSDSQRFHLTITGSSTPPSIQTTSLPAGTVGAAYSANLNATGGSTPYTWAVSAGSLPAGIALDSASGTLSGTPTAAGNFDFTASVTDTSNQSATKQLRITVNPPPPPPPPLSITTTTLGNGTVGQVYSSSVSATGGTPPYNWSVTAGALPGGLSLSTSGAISGTPTAAGAFDFTVSVTDAGSQSGTKQLRITINPPPRAPTQHHHNNTGQWNSRTGLFGQCFCNRRNATIQLEPFGRRIAGRSEPFFIGRNQRNADNGRRFRFHRASHGLRKSIGHEAASDHDQPRAPANPEYHHDNPRRRHSRPSLFR